MEFMMSYKDIVVFLDGSPDNEARVDFAVSLARDHAARLTGVDVNSEDAFKSEWSERAKAAEELLKARSRLLGVTSRFRIADRNSRGWKNFYAHYADLLVATQPDGSFADRVLPGFPENVLVSAGVPMIVLPRGWTCKHQIQNAVIAWSPSSQASRAVHDAMPILTRANNVAVFAFDPLSDSQDDDVKLICDHLLAHGIKADTDRWPATSDLEIIEALFASRPIEDADIIVAGAFSHSRLREALFGGTTKDLLRQISVPILVSH